MESKILITHDVVLKYWGYRLSCINIHYRDSKSFLLLVDQPVNIEANICFKLNRFVLILSGAH
jgi:hypothetical protein